MTVRGQIRCIVAPLPLVRAVGLASSVDLAQCSSIDLCDAGLDEEDGGGDIFEEEHDEDLLF